MKTRYIRLLAIILPLLALLGGLLAISSAFVQINTQRSEYQQRSINNLYSTGVQNKISEYRDMLTLLAGSISLQSTSEFRYASPESSGVPGNKMLNQRKRLDDMIRINQDIYALQIVDSQGRNLICEPYYLQQNIGPATYAQTYKDTDWFKGALEANTQYIDTGFTDMAQLSVYMSAPYTDALGHEPTIAISAPIRFDDGSIGVLMGRLSLKSFAFFDENTDQSFSGVTYITNTNGELIAFPNQTTSMNKTIGDSDMMKDITGSGRVEGQIDGIIDPVTGKKSNIYYNYDVPDGWYFITVLDKKPLYTFNILTYAGAVILYAAIVTTLLFSRKNSNLKNQISLQRLIAAVADGNFIVDAGLQNYYQKALDTLSQASPAKSAAIIDLIGSHIICRKGHCHLPPKGPDDQKQLLHLFTENRVALVNRHKKSESSYLNLFCEINRLPSAAFYGLIADGNVVGMITFSFRKMTAALLTELESVGRSMEQTLIGKLTEHRIFLERDRLRITLESIGDGVLVTDSKGIVTIINHVASQLTGYPPEEAVGKKFTEIFLISGEDGASIISPVEHVLKTGEICEHSDNARLHARGGQLYDISQSAAPIRDEAGNPHGVVLVFRDITRSRQYEKDILYLNYHDNLTRVYNRNYFDKRLSELEEAGNLPISVIMGDVNGLKLANDAFGHAEGDRLLKSIANVLVESSREQDMVIRWGGDEFILVMPGADNDDAAEVCKKIAQKCDNFNKSQSDSVTTLLSISTGYATKSYPNQSIMMTIKQAEDLMYNKKLLESRSLHNSILTSIRNTLNEKSHETEEHAARMQKLCREIGERMKLSEEDLSDLELLALLHDVGKIAISDNILSKPGELTDEEWKQMKRHCEIGYRIASASPEIRHIANYILTHHERWDGSGYPQGLKGEEIPLLSRILSVADTYDAMTQDRVYRKKVSGQAALREIAANAGKQFDPNIVEIFLRVEGVENNNQ